MNRPVYRPIVKRERQRGQRVDVLACGHAVPVDAATHANTYRRARACPHCAATVAAYRAESETTP